MSKGSLPGLRMGTSAAFSSKATGAAKMNPRASAAATTSIFSRRKGLAMSTTARRNAAGLANSGVMSRNRIPGLGKSGMLRM